MGGGAALPHSETLIIKSISDQGTVNRPPSRMALSGRHLAVASEKWYPWVDVTEDNSWSGIAVTLLSILAQKMNFTYHFVRPQDHEWGRMLPNGSFTGMVGMLERKEVDLALGPLSVSWERYQKADYSTFIYMDWWGILLPRPRRETDFAGFLKPFTLEVWLALAASLLVTLMVGVILKTKTSINFEWIARALMNEGES
ncbi:probable glutamate receptor [Penaeus japonicus]|uniref:probable glutamate receptor n=1 Tax=Penaeus japonicus TaxID=27405 RepID=UPI001C70E0B8|nr:probable glutamate receptor [Penaeus japonicus]